ncbi:MAG: large conductance mechanosensitive channel protein MscL [Phycisphaerales bacterium]|nr:large conductance mechanosensitive channel protein MscL [Phycisphaerales bacterium]
MLKPTSLVQEFKSFAFKGNMIDMAVGIIIGAAFGKVISSLVGDIFMPLIAAVMPNDKGYEAWTFIINGSTIPYGKFIATLVDFLLVALAVFLVIVKIVQGTLKRTEPAAAPAAPTTRECPYCLSNIPLKAKRCPHCTSELPA